MDAEKSLVGNATKRVYDGEHFLSGGLFVQDFGGQIVHEYFFDYLVLLIKGHGFVVVLFLGNTDEIRDVFEAKLDGLRDVLLGETDARLVPVDQTGRGRVEQPNQRTKFHLYSEVNYNDP